MIPTAAPRWLNRARPSSANVRDGVATLLLITLGLVGFRAAFGGSKAISTGLVAAVVGVGLGHLSGRLRWTALMSVVAVLVAYIVVGGPLIAPSETLLGLPTPGSFGAVVDGGINGWAGLVQTLAPVGDAGNLLAVPVLCGLLGAMLSMILAVRGKRAELVILPATAVLVASVLLGTRYPVSLILQGVAFIAVAMWWTSDRYDRGRMVTRRIDLRRRAIYGVGMVLVAGVGAVAVGPNLPVLGGSNRYVLRERSQPTFDPRQYPSPLAGLRRYLVGDDKDKVVLRVQGLPANQAIRLAVLDTYDGVVWGVGQGATSAGRFQAAGTSFPVDVPGPSAAIRVEVVSLPGVWVPTVGTVRNLEVNRATEDRLRYNAVTGALAKPMGTAADTLRPGEVFAYESVLTAPPTPETLAGLAVDPTKATANMDLLPDDFRARAADAISGASTPYEQVRKVESLLQEGFYSDGGNESRPVASGHSLFRLNNFVAAGALEGDAEQYAATMAIYANAIGIPARVVLGFRPEASPGAETVEVRNRDFDAWVEIPFADAGWVAFYPTPPRTRALPDTAVVPPTTLPGGKSRTNPPALNLELPDSVAKPPPSTIPTCEPSCPPKAEGSGPAGWLLALAGGLGASVLVVGVPPLLIVAAKRRRRRRRRRRADASAQIAGAWEELLDRATDLGRAVPLPMTRPEAAVVLARPEIAHLAADADAATFGSEPPEAAASATYWQRVEESAAGLAADHTRRVRVRAALSTASLRTSGHRRQTHRRAPAASRDGDRPMVTRP